MSALFALVFGIAIGAMFADPIGAATQKAYAWLVAKFDAWRD